MDIARALRDAGYEIPEGVWTLDGLLDALAPDHGGSA